MSRPAPQPLCGAALSAAMTKALLCQGCILDAPAWACAALGSLGRYVSPSAQEEDAQQPGQALQVGLRLLSCRKQLLLCLELATQAAGFVHGGIQFVLRLTQHAQEFTLRY